MRRETYQLLWNSLQWRGSRDKGKVVCSEVSPVRLAGEQEALGESNIERLRVIDIVNLLLGQLDSQSP